MMRRWIFGILAAVCLILFLPSCWMSGDSLKLRIVLTRASGYDGCLCPDCYRIYGIGRGPSGGCGCGRAGESAITFITGCAGLTTLALAILPIAARRATPGTCSFCGYDISGLDRCPECGLEPVPPLAELTPETIDPAISPPDPPSPLPTPPARC